MKKILFLFLLFFAFDAHGNLSWNDRNETLKSIDFSKIYDRGFDAGVKCTVREIKKYIDSDMNEEEFLLRLNQCKYECQKEYIEEFVKDQIEVFIELMREE